MNVFISFKEKYLNESLGIQKNDTYQIPLNVSEANHFKAAKELIEILESNFNCNIALVGGAVRDLFYRFYHGNKLENEKLINDLDFSIFKPDGNGFTSADFEKINTYLNNNGYSVDTSGLKFQHLMIMYKGFEIDLGTPRKEAYLDNSRKPITKIGNIVDDILRRDFTVNAIYTEIIKVNTNSVILKPNKSSKEFLDDISKKILRSVNTNIDKVLNDDPIRILRAIRFSGYGYKIEDKLKNKINSFDSDKIFQKVSKERITDELGKVLSKGDIDFFIKGGFIKKIIKSFNEFTGKPFEEDELIHITEVVRNVKKYVKNPKDILVFIFAALFHDIGKSKTGVFKKDKWQFLDHDKISAQMAISEMNFLKLPNEFQKRVEKIIYLHMQIKFVTDWKLRTLIKFIMSNSDQTINDVILFNKIDWSGKSKEWQNIMNVEQKQKQILNLFSKYLPKVRKIEKKYKKELANISKKTSKKYIGKEISKQVFIARLNFIIKMIKE